MKRKLDLFSLRLCCARLPATSPTDGSVPTIEHFEQPNPMPCNLLPISTLYYRVGYRRKISTWEKDSSATDVCKVTQQQARLKEVNLEHMRIFKDHSVKTDEAKNCSSLTVTAFSHFPLRKFYGIILFC